MEFNLYDVLAALALVGVAVGISMHQKLKLEKDLLVGTLRSFVQLIAIGYALEIIFDLNKLYLLILTILVMIIIGSYTAGKRAHISSQGFTISFLAIGIGTFITVGSMLLLRIINTDPKYLIPIAGMIVGNSMNASALALDRIDSEVKNKKAQIEAALALGATSSQAIESSVRATVKASMIPMINLMKIIGLVQLPGAMTGMIIAGASPVSAVIIQIIVIYMLVSAVTISSVLTTILAKQQYFTGDHQLAEMIG